MFLDDRPGKEEAPDKAVEDLAGLAQALAQQPLYDALSNLFRAVDTGGQRAGFLLPAPVLLHPPVAAAGGVGPSLGESGVERLQGIRGEPVVGVGKGKVFAVCHGHAQVPGGADPAVVLVEDPHTGVLLGDLVAQFPAVVGGAIVDEQKLQVAKGLVQDGVSTLAEKCLRPVDRYDHRNFRHTRPSFFTR